MESFYRTLNWSVSYFYPIVFEQLVFVSTPWRKGLFLPNTPGKELHIQQVFLDESMNKWKPIDRQLDSVVIFVASHFHRQVRGSTVTCCWHIFITCNRMWGGRETDRSISHCSRCHQYSAHFLLGPFTIVVHVGSRRIYSPKTKAGSSNGRGEAGAGGGGGWSQATGIYLSINKWEIPADRPGEGSLILRLGSRSMTAWVLLSSISSALIMPSTVSGDFSVSLSQCWAPQDFAWYHMHFLTPYLFLMATLCG